MRQAYFKIKRKNPVFSKKDTLGHAPFQAKEKMLYLRRTQIKDASTAAGFILAHGVADVSPKDSRYFPEKDCLAIYADLEIFALVPNPGISEKAIRIFLEGELANEDFRSYASMFHAARAAQEKGLLKLQHRLTRELPGIVIDSGTNKQL